ncbi:hypothetical protein AcW1_004172 [Taiwanofungus camphoratus]|nr:hypothetical protein AcW1_004172 [Antrodia cinnamomea]
MIQGPVALHLNQVMIQSSSQVKTDNQSADAPSKSVNQWPRNETMSLGSNTLRVQRNSLPASPYSRSSLPLRTDLDPVSNQPKEIHRDYESPSWTVLSAENPDSEAELEPEEDELETTMPAPRDVNFKSFTKGNHVQQSRKGGPLGLRFSRQVDRSRSHSASETFARGYIASLTPGSSSRPGVQSGKSSARRSPTSQQTIKSQAKPAQKVKRQIFDGVVITMPSSVKVSREKAKASGTSNGDHTASLFRDWGPSFSSCQVGLPAQQASRKTGTGSASASPPTFVQDDTGDSTGVRRPSNAPLAEGTRPTIPARSHVTETDLASALTLAFVQNSVSEPKAVRASSQAPSAHDALSGRPVATTADATPDGRTLRILRPPAPNNPHASAAYWAAVDELLGTEVARVAILESYAQPRGEEAELRSRQALRFVRHNAATTARAGTVGEWAAYTAPRYSLTANFKERLDLLLGPGDINRGLRRRPKPAQGRADDNSNGLHTFGTSVTGRNSKRTRSAEHETSFTDSSETTADEDILPTKRRKVEDVSESLGTV